MDQVRLQWQEVILQFQKVHGQCLLTLLESRNRKHYPWWPAQNLYLGKTILVALFLVFSFECLKLVPLAYP